MPNLHKYAESNTKDGFYIYAQHNGQNVTYQVTSLARRIFERLEYGDGTDITGEMLYTLHRLQLIYTNNSGVEPPTSFDEITDEIEVPSSADSGRKQFFHTIIENGDLNDEEQRDLIRYLDEQDLRPSSAVESPQPVPTEEWRPATPDATTVYRGTVDFFNDTGGYGFIRCPLLEDDVFYHMEDLGGRDISEETPVEFVWRNADEGPRATHVRLLDNKNLSTHKRTLKPDSFGGRPSLDEFQRAKSYHADLKIELLGTGGHWATEERIANTILVEREPELFLFDVGEGAYRQMQQQNTGFALDAIFLTSTETDHIGGLGPLLSALSIQGQVTDLEIYVPANGVDTIQSLLDLYGEFELSVAIEPVEDGVIYDDDKYTIEAFQTDTDGARRGYVLSEIPQRGRFNRDRAEALGVPVGSDFQRLCEGKIIVTEEDEKVDPRQVVGDPTPGRKLVYTGDVPDPGVIPPVIDSADFLIHEAAYLDDESSTSGHATAKVAGEIAQKADVDALVLTNVAPVSSWRTNQLVDQAAAQFDGEVRLATDGTTLRLPVPEPTDAPAATPAINYGEPVSESDLEEGMYISLTVDRKKNSNKGLSKRGTVHIRDGDKYVGKKVTVKIVSKRTGYVVAVVETPSSGTTVYPYGPTNSSSNGSKQGSSKKNTKSGQKRISNSSSPFKTGDSSHLRDLVQKKH